MVAVSSDPVDPNAPIAKKPVSFKNLAIGTVAPFCHPASPLLRMSSATLNMFEVTTLGQPLEVVKTQMAANRGQSMFASIGTVWSRGGVLGFYQGLIPWAWIEASTKGAVLMFAVSELEYHARMSGASAPVAGILGGMGGGIAQAYATMGFCTFMKTVEVTRHKGGEAAAKSTLEVAADIFRREGIRGINKGVNAVALRQCTNWGSRFGLSRIAEDAIKGKDKTRKLSDLEKIAASSLGGALSTWNQPIEVIRVEMQSQLKTVGRPEKLTIASAAGWIYKQNGFIGFYRGVTPRICLGMWQTICMVAFGDKVKAYFDQENCKNCCLRTMSSAAPGKGNGGGVPLVSEIVKKLETERRRKLMLASASDNVVAAEQSPTAFAKPKQDSTPGDTLATGPDNDPGTSKSGQGSSSILTTAISEAAAKRMVRNKAQQQQEQYEPPRPREQQERPQLKVSPGASAPLRQTARSPDQLSPRAVSAYGQVGASGSSHIAGVSNGRAFLEIGTLPPQRDNGEVTTLKTPLQRKLQATMASPRTKSLDVKLRDLANNLDSCEIEPKSTAKPSVVQKLDDILNTLSLDIEEAGFQDSAGAHSISPVLGPKKIATKKKPNLSPTYPSSTSTSKSAYSPVHSSRSQSMIEGGQKIVSGHSYSTDLKSATVHSAVNQYAQSLDSITSASSISDSNSSGEIATQVFISGGVRQGSSQSVISPSMKLSSAKLSSIDMQLYTPHQQSSSRLHGDGYSSPRTSEDLLYESAGGKRERKKSNVVEYEDVQKFYENSNTGTQLSEILQQQRQQQQQLRRQQQHTLFEQDSGRARVARPLTVSSGDTSPSFQAGKTKPTAAKLPSTSVNIVRMGSYEFGSASRISVDETGLDSSLKFDSNPTMDLPKGLNEFGYVMREPQLEKLGKVGTTPGNFFVSRACLYCTSIRGFPIPLHHILQVTWETKKVYVTWLFKKPVTNEPRVLDMEIEFPDMFSTSQWALKLQSISSKGNTADVFGKQAIFLIDEADRKQCADCLKNVMIPVLEAAKKPFDILLVESDSDRLRATIDKLRLQNINSITYLQIKNTSTRSFKMIDEYLLAAAKKATAYDSKLIKVLQPEMDPLEIALSVIKGWF
ncbi:hypothetical protein HDU82_007934 [Entophlyctis luteolus]|nr:hypothetical protein HDU82_007934 [Entophlyctis luteolus]